MKNKKSLVDGQKIKRRRLELGMSQLKLAYAISKIKGEPVDPSGISLWESEAREPRPENLKDLARALKCKISDLMKEA